MYLKMVLRCISFNIMAFNFVPRLYQTSNKEVEADILVFMGVFTHAFLYTHIYIYIHTWNYVCTVWSLFKECFSDTVVSALHCKPPGCGFKVSCLAYPIDRNVFFSNKIALRSNPSWISDGITLKLRMSTWFLLIA